MANNILIVEDQFIEANDLRSMLEQAGHRVCGMARSVEQARELINSDLPDIVLIDIYLKGKLTGIDLARELAIKNIPFIYLSANSNPSTLAEAKATQPYGFLVKPFREKDILIALEIATYRYKHAQDILIRHEAWLSGLLTNLISKEGGIVEKLQLLASAFQPFVHFDFMLIDTDLNSRDSKTLTVFQRTDYDEYQQVDIFSAGDSFLLLKDLNESRKSVLLSPAISYRNGEDFIENLVKHKISRHMHKNYQVQSDLLLPVVSEKVGASMYFYSLQPVCFSDEQLKLFCNLLPVLLETIYNLGKKNIVNNKPYNSRHNAGELKRANFPDIVGTSPKLLNALDQITQVAPYDTSVLILGETGSGKEGLVNLIHQLSPRNCKPMIKINCAAIPESLIESELFGHEKGAFTGASERRIGKFEQARGGTIFLDEIGEIPLDVQSKLLRVLQEKEIERLGGRQTIKTDVRIIAATNRNLHEEVAKGNFRMDLYYRINVFPITLAPLRDRKEDIPALVSYFLIHQGAANSQKVKTIAPQVLKQLQDYSWPGNIRQLQHVIERAFIMTYDEEITIIELPEEAVVMPVVAPPNPIRLQSIDELEKSHIMEIIRNCNGKISGNGGAAEVLKLPPATLRLKMKKLGIQWQHTFER